MSELNLPDHVVQILKKLPRFRRPSRNEPCLCGSGKKYGSCCIGKRMKEIQAIRNARIKKRVIRKIESTIPKDHFMVLDVSRPMIGLSFEYGLYPTKEWALYFARNRTDLSDVEFIKLFNQVLFFLETLGCLAFRTNIIVNRDTAKIEEFEILFMAFKSDYVCNVVRKSNASLSSNLDILGEMCMDIALKIHCFLQEKGLSSTYPRYVEMEHIEQITEESTRTQFSIELRSAQKLLYMSTLVSDIVSKSGSPIEIDLGVRLAEHNVPFVQQMEITDQYPKLPQHVHSIAKPDFFISVIPRPIAIFCDGHAYHEKTPEQATRDRRIDRELQQMNFVVLRFTGAEIRNNVDRCVEEVKAHFLGKEYSKSPSHVLASKLAMIDRSLLNEWELRFLSSMWDWISQNKPATIRQERVIKRLLDRSAHTKSKTSQKTSS